ncbi:MAG: TaqI family restriction endonuclease [Candidatus Hydrothermia bacterium]|jgi:hypothetical protein
MRNTKESDLYRFRDFLGKIPLVKYREEFKDIKWVEQDLPKEILPLRSIYKYYWDKREFLDFEEWFEEFWKEINENQESKKALEEFKKYYFNRTIEENDWFKKGFKARMYRTWISILTQLDFFYMFEYICEKEGRNFKIECNAELDMKGIDAKVGETYFQIAKITHRKEARPGKRKMKIIQVPYAVFDIEELQRRIQNPRTRNKEKYRKLLKAFEKYFDVLENGFVAFKEDYVKMIIENLENQKELEKIISKIFKEFQ